MTDRTAIENGVHSLIRKTSLIIVDRLQWPGEPELLVTDLLHLERSTNTRTAFSATAIGPLGFQPSINDGLHFRRRPGFDENAESIPSR